ncbi:BspA family leucine-rich repeat surface protein [Allomuricauda sp. ARW1Y1]|jgi:surface protein|uniref:BspA family leucine-rich repeat surface protein n=1 Tax=Allomuricauda sp. ARW1Y1 TaxID=2663843 RepID=UPI0015CE3E40|nr:BspA family leucine-rich repeat surface protein [Muricauda sp. ARW1Y1]NYJ27001.1 surface protein [Muricauda sp. ARW1Y1]
MKARFLFLIMVSFVVFWSCEPNEPDSVLINNAPVVPSQTFTVPENFPDGQLIGVIQATDKDEDALEFSLIQESNGLFEVAKNGNLFLAAGKKLSNAVQEEHVLDVYVHDGVVGRKGSVTIKVTPPENLPPIAEDKIFDDIIETLPEGELIGVLEAVDPEGEPLTYEIIEDEDGLFAVTNNGEIVLAEGQSLDFETSEQHTIVVSVSDGVNTVEITVTINVLDDGDIFDDPASFITTWNVETDGQELIIGTNPEFSYDYTIDWGDGNVEQITTNESPSHVYATMGTYTVAINGQFPALNMSESDVLSQEALVDVVQWGSQQWQSMAAAFHSCVNLESFSAADLPDLTQVETIALMFYNASAFNGDLSQWEVGNVVDMRTTFGGATNFNGDLSDWDVGNVTLMTSMFREASSFNQDISNWNVLNVTHMDNMFTDAISFNQDISGWEVDNVTQMLNMFRRATSFNQDLGAWNIESIVSMFGMFQQSGMSTLNYSATLRGWASLGDDSIPDGINLGAAGINFCDDTDTVTARIDILQDANSWDITDAGPVTCN